MSNQKTLLVTGASGQLGTRVIELLLEANAGKIIAATRNPDKLGALALRGVEIRQADFDDPSSLQAAFAGVDRLLIISTDAVDGSDRRQRQHRNAVEAAQAAGVGHVLYTSLVNPGPESAVTFAADHRLTEEALAESNFDWTVLRNNLYADLFLQSLPRAIQSGQLVSAIGDGKVGYVTREDCARAAAAALASDSTGRNTLDITGPALVSQTEIAQILSEISGREVSYVPIDVATLTNGLLGAGLPEGVARMIASFDQAAADGTLAVATNTVEELTGKPAQSVKDFLNQHRAALLG
jgi:NAD(P)H dehydrogenase (quinone)